MSYQDTPLEPGLKPGRNSYLATVLALLVVTAWLLSQPVAASGEVVWQPYLQQMTATGVIIQWTTTGGETPTVRYSPGLSFDQTAAGASRPLPLGTRLQRVELTGLQPDTLYRYKIYVDEVELLPQEILWFRTAPRHGSKRPFTFLALGDFGDGSVGQRRLRERLAVEAARFIVTTGDNAYPDGRYEEFEAYLFQVYTDLFSRLTLFPSLGNHDYHTGRGAPYLDIFDLPGNAWRAEDRERYYTFDYGNAHFVVLDTDRPVTAVDAAAEDDMFDWLRHTLAHTPQRWKIVVLHVSPYATGFNSRDGEILTRPKLPPIFEAYGVDLVLGGHVHSYQRSYPLRGGQIVAPDQGGVVYIVSGAGAAASYPCETADWLAVTLCGQTTGLFSRVRIAGNQLQVEAVDAQGAIRDTLVLTKALNLPPLEVVITGPEAAPPESGVTLTAAVSPVTTTLPLTYTWQVEGQPPLTQSGGLAHTAVFTWTKPGTYSVVVSAASASGATVSQSRPFVITGP